MNGQMKRVLSGALVLALLLSVLPLEALAAQTAAGSETRESALTEAAGPASADLVPTEEEPKVSLLSLFRERVMKAVMTHPADAQGEGGEEAVEGSAEAVLDGPEISTGDYTYQLDGENAVITGYTGAGGEITIPPALDGHPVTGIGASAFSGADLRACALPEGLTSLGSHAFGSCNNLREVYIPKTLQTTGSWGPFTDCPSLSTVTFGPGTTEIIDRLFLDCNGLTAVAIPDTVTRIGNSAFAGTLLSTCALPEGLTSLGSYAFGNCDNLREVYLPATLQTTGSWGPFTGCDSLSAVTFGPGITEIIDRLFRDCDGLTAITIPDTVTRIGENAFAGTGLTACALPEGLTSLGYYAFGNCDKLREVYIPKSLKTTDSWGPFADCDSLNTVYFEAGITEIIDRLFRNCGGLTAVTIPDTVTRIGENAFAGTGLIACALPEGLTRLGSYAFGNCDKLREVYIPKSLKMTDSWGPFTDCDSLSTVTFEPGISEIIDRLFLDCDGLASITIPDTVTRIGEDAFSGTGLSTCSLPEGLTSLGSYAFGNCDNLKKVYIPKALKNTDEWGPFADCDSLNEVIFGRGITEIIDRLFRNCGGLTAITIPDSITRIGENAFAGTSLSTCVLPERLVSLGSYAFGNCDKLREVYIPRTLQTTGSWGPFTDCDSLSTITFAAGITTIPADLFRGCDGLNAILIPETVTRINDRAFSGCENLQGVSIPNPVCTLGRDLFFRCPRLTLHCPSASLAALYAIDNDIPVVPHVTPEDNASSVLDYSATSLYGDIDGMSASGRAAFTLRYRIKDQWKDRVSGLHAQIRLPRTLTLDQGSIRVDGDRCDNYWLDDTLLTVPLTEKEGIIRYTGKVTQGGSVLSFAKLSMIRDEEKAEELLGIVNERAGPLTLELPDQTGKANFTVSGVSPASAVVTLSVDGVENCSVTATKAGNWTAEIHLNDPRDYHSYQITASCQNGEESLSRSADILYHENTASITGFVVKYNEHDVTRTCDLFLTKGIRPVICYSPNTEYRFEVRFDDPEQVKKVVVTSTRNGEKKSLDAVYDAKSGVFATSGVFDPSDPSYIPGKIGVEFFQRAEEILVSQEVDWNRLTEMLNPDFLNQVDVTREIEKSSIKGTIDFSGVDGFETGEVIGYEISYGSEPSHINAAELLYLANNNLSNDVVSHTVPGADGQSYRITLDFRSTDGALLLVTGGAKLSEYIASAQIGRVEPAEGNFLREYTDAFDTAGTAVFTLVSLVRDMYGIQRDSRQLREDILNTPNAIDVSKALKQADDLERDRRMFTLMSSLLPIIAAGNTGTVNTRTVMAGPALVFTGIAAAMRQLSDAAFEYRQTDLLGFEIFPRFIVSPSGYVYDSNTKERLEGVTATAYWIEADGSEDFWDAPPAKDANGTQWDAGEYNQQNPLRTNGDGCYAWDLPEGWWRVKFEKEGYVTAWSGWMTVPPIQTGVNIGLEPSETEYIAGDVNSDGEVNAKDRTILSRYLARWKDYDEDGEEKIDKRAADVNEDDAVNARDRTILSRFLAKWKGYETLPYLN